MQFEIKRTYYNTQIIMNRFSDDEIVDAVIIGTGAGGAPLLARLANLLQSIGIIPVTYASQEICGRGLWGEELQQCMRGYHKGHLRSANRRVMAAAESSQCPYATGLTEQDNFGSF